MEAGQPGAASEGDGTPAFDHVAWTANLHEAITAQRLVVSAMSADQPQRGVELSVLAELLLERYRSTGQSDDLNEAVSFARAALASPRADRSESAAVLANLGVAMRHRFTRTGNLDDLNEAIQLGRAALGAVADDDPHRAAFIGPLGVALRIRFSRSGEATDLEEAIQLGRQAVALADRDPVNRPAVLTGLGLALQTRFGQSGNLRDIDEAIDLARQALAIAGDADRERPTFLMNLSASLALRFRAEGRPADVADAIEFGQQAIAITPPGHPSRPAIVTSFDYVQRLRIEASPSAVDEARPELVDAVRLSHIAIGAGLPGPIGALAADVLAGDLDIWQAEARAATIFGPILSDATELEDWSLTALERATNGIWAESVVFLRLLMTAIEGAADGSPLERARASVGANFVAVEALALTSHADPELFTRALVAGQWAEDWAGRHGRTDIRLRVLNSMTLLHLLPYTTSQQPETYDVDHVRWLRNTRAQANLTDVIPVHDLGPGGVLTPRDPTFTMPEPREALHAAESYARAAVATTEGDAAHRDTAIGQLLRVLQWRARFGDDVDVSELAKLHSSAREDVDHITSRIGQVAKEILRLGDTGAYVALSELLNQLAPELAIAALGLSLTRPSGHDPDLILELAELRGHLIGQYGDEQDRVDQAALEVGLIRSLYGSDFDDVRGLPDDVAFDDIVALVSQLSVGPASTALARAAWLIHLANLLAERPSGTHSGVEALDAARRASPQLVERHHRGLSETFLR